jgi:hypothetical protein
MAEKDEQVTWYWKDIPGVMAGISHKNAGWMNADADDPVRGGVGKTNRDRFFAGVGLRPERVVLAGLKHTLNIMAVGETQAGQVVYGKDGIDGLSTNVLGLILAVTVADCLPIYFYEPRAKVAAITHAGWRGVLNNIAGKTVEHLNKTYSGVDLANLQVLIGPGIRPCHFEVRSDVEELFKKEYADYIDCRDGHIYINLPAIIKLQLLQAGLTNSNIQDTGECNYDLADKYFSFRRERPAKPQSMVAFIALA